MSLQWTLVAGFLYAEIAVVIILMLPIISAKMWQKFFKSRFLRSLAAYANFYFSAFFVILLLLFLDSLRQMHKYSNARDQESSEHGHGHLDAELQLSMKMFRAQRNCYIAGFALFLAPVIRRIGTLLSNQATLTASAEASLKQARSASEAAEKLMQDRDNNGSGDNLTNSRKEELENEIKSLKETLQSTKSDLERTKTDLMVVKGQAEGTNREYDRLLQEHEKLQKKFETGENRKSE